MLHSPDEAIRLALTLHAGDPDFQKHVDSWVSSLIKLGRVALNMSLEQILLSRVEGGQLEENFAQWLLRTFPKSA